MRPPMRVCLIHTSDLRTFPPDGSFVDAAERAVIMAGHVPLDMAYLPACAIDPAEHSRLMVERADVVVELIGPGYGSTVRNNPDESYVQREDSVAVRCGITRVVFFVGWSGPSRVPCHQSAEKAARQRQFRQRLEDEELTTAEVATPAELKLKLYQSLVNLRRPTRRR